MSKNLEPKCKQCRRIGEKLMLKGERCMSAKCAIVKRNYPPGVHGSKGKKRLSGYGEQLQEKQKAKKIYNLMEKQFKLTFEKAKRMKGDVGENFIKMLETRLDNVIFRMGFAESRGKARAIISHGHFTVNGVKVDIPSFQVKKGDVIKISKTTMSSKLFTNLKEKIKTYEAPGWIYNDKEELSGKILHAPAMTDVNSNINVHMVVEFYSR